MRVLPYLCGSAVLVVACLEASLWLAAPLPYSVQHPVRQYLTQQVPGLKPRILFEEDAFGFRSRSMRGIRKPAETIRIICVGASTTQQTTQSIDDMWCTILEQLLQDALDTTAVRVETAALGSGGATVFDGVDQCAQILPPFDPDIVVTLWGINDLAWHGGPAYRYPDPRRRHETDWRRRLRRYSQLYRRIRYIERQTTLRRALERGDAVEWHTQHLPVRRAEYQRYPYRETIQRDPDPIHEFRAGTAQLLGCLRDRHITTVVLGQPVLWKPDPSEEERAALWFFVNTPTERVRMNTAWLVREMQRYNSVQRDVAYAYQATYVPLDQQLAKTLEIFYDDCHFTDAGSRAVARAILPAVKAAVDQVRSAR